MTKKNRINNLFGKFMTKFARYPLPLSSAYTKI